MVRAECREKEVETKGMRNKALHSSVLFSNTCCERLERFGQKDGYYSATYTRKK